MGESGKCFLFLGSEVSFLWPLSSRQQPHPAGEHRAQGSNPDRSVPGRPRWAIILLITYHWHFLLLHLYMAGSEVLGKCSFSNETSLKCQRTLKAKLAQAEQEATAGWRRPSILAMLKGSRLTPKAMLRTYNYSLPIVKSQAKGRAPPNWPP